MLIHETTEEAEYKKGYDCGYEWLASGRWNFLHPTATYTYPNGRKLYGYIPGGPAYFSRYETYQKEYVEEREKIYRCSQAWHQGWIDGINKYVADNKLGYPQLDRNK